MKPVRRILKRIILTLLITGVLAGGAFFVYVRFGSAQQSFELTDDLGGNIFPSAVLSTATTSTLVITPRDTLYLGNPKSCIAIRIKAPLPNSRVRIEIGESPFFRRSVSEFILPERGKTYTIYPDIIWEYEALKENDTASPVSVVAEAELNGKTLGQRVRTFSVRSINECLIGYIGRNNTYRTTYVFFAAYVNEEHPMIDEVLREALNTRIVNRFLGYQSKQKNMVEKQVYALWNVLQKRHFQYSSVSYSSLSSNVVSSQRVRTFGDAIKSSQINCVDGSVLFASLLRAVNIDPVLVRTPGHMFVGYYTDNRHNGIQFLETTMIGDINLDDFFPDEQLDSTVVGKSQNEMSRLTFEKSKEYATRKYEQYKDSFGTNTRDFMYLEISRGIRKQIQPIGK